MIANNFHVQTSILFAPRAFIFATNVPAGNIFMLKITLFSPIEITYFRNFLAGHPWASLQNICMFKSSILQAARANTNSVLINFFCGAIQDLSSIYFHVQTIILLASRALVVLKISIARQSNLSFQLIFMLKLAFSWPLEP